MSKNDNPYQSPKADIAGQTLDESEAIYKPMSMVAIAVVSLIFPGCPSVAMRATKKRLPLFLCTCVLYVLGVLFLEFIESDFGSSRLYQLFGYMLLVVYSATAISSVVLGLSDRNYLISLNRSIVAEIDPIKEAPN